MNLLIHKPFRCSSKRRCVTTLNLAHYPKNQRTKLSFQVARPVISSYTILSLKVTMCHQVMLEMNLNCHSHSYHFKFMFLFFFLLSSPINKFNFVLQKSMCNKLWHWLIFSFVKVRVVRVVGQVLYLLLEQPLFRVVLRIDRFLYRYCSFAYNILQVSKTIVNASPT